MKQTFLFLFACFITFFINKSEAIQCYKCESIGGNDIGCELGKRDQPYANPCYVGVNTYVKGNRCIKIVGQSVYDHQRVVIRDCTDRTHDKEGMISYDRHLINGRAYTCKSNLCNGATRLIHRKEIFTIFIFVSLVILMVQKYSKISL